MDGTDVRVDCTRPCQERGRVINRSFLMTLELEFMIYYRAELCKYIYYIFILHCYFIARVIPNIFTDPSFDAIIHMTANRNETVVGQDSGQLDQKVVGSPDRTSLD